MSKRIKVEFIAIIMSIAMIMTACNSKKELQVMGNPDIGGAYSEMFLPEFWIGDGYDKELLTKEQVQQCNYNMTHTSSFKVFDLDEHPQELTKKELEQRISPYVIPTGQRYTGKDGKTPVTREYHNRLSANRNMSNIAETNPVKYGIVTAQTELRSFPGAEPSYTEAGDIEFDDFIQNTMKVWERCIILHTSSDGKWYFVQSMSFRGWIRSEDAAICDKETWQKYNAMDFLVVTGNRIKMDVELYDNEFSEKEMLMGTRIPLAEKQDSVNGVHTLSSYTVLMPSKGNDGRLVEKVGRIPLNADVTLGYLPFTKENLIRQSFKMMGERYGWGADFNARDCSAFLRDIYFCFGIEIPKNSTGQGDMPATKKIDVKNMDEQQKEKVIMEQNPGAILEMQGHVAMYIGQFNGKAYVIHDVYAFGESGKNGEGGRTKINCVTVSDLYVTRKDGSTFLENIRKVNSMA